MAAKRKKTANKTATRHHPVHSFADLKFFGKKLHPIWSLITGVVISPFGGLLTLIGGILAVASLVHLMMHYSKTAKK